VSLRIHLGFPDPALRRRLAALLRTDPEVVLVAEPERAELIVMEGTGAEPARMAAPAEEEAGPLTGRELEVLRLMAQGLGNKSIARALGISSHTAKYHVASVLAKLGSHSRAEAVSRGLRRGLLPL
jgi:DNA-binding NarL/FixJ family response regulator